MHTDTPLMWQGLSIRICEDDVRPKMQLSEGCPVTPEFRVEMNAWMREFFGAEVSNLLPDGQTYHMVATGELYMNRRTFAQLKKASIL